MRETALKFALAATLALAAPLAHALAKTPAKHKPIPAAHTVVRTKLTRATRPVAVKAASIKSRHGREASSRYGHARPAGREARLEARRVPRPVVAERSTPAPIVRVQPGSEPAPDQEPIQVTHDRKQHFSADPGASDPASGKPKTPDDQAAAQPSAPARSAPAEVKAAPPVVVPVLYNKRGRLIVPPAMKGSREILVHQNEMADQEGLDRIRDDASLEGMREAKLLVPIPSVAGLQLDERLPANRRYCRPWTEQFLTTLARAYYARFHSSLQVNSAVRTVEVQERLLRTNGNAAPVEGETASPHLTGQAVDLAKHGLSMTQIAWLRGYLMPLVQAGKVDVEEEFQQACFHISVYRKYLPQPAPKREIAEKRPTTGAALAAAIR